MGCGHRTVEQECIVWPPGAVHTLDATPPPQEGWGPNTHSVGGSLEPVEERGAGCRLGRRARVPLATSEASCCRVTLHPGGYTSLHHCSRPLCPQGFPDTLDSCFSPALPSPKFCGEDLHASCGRSQALSVNEVVPCPSQGASSRGPGHRAAGR